MTHYDLIVIGGGLSGVASAVSAKREGLNVLLIERSGCLGGAIAQNLSNLLHINLPVWTGLLLAAIMIWVIDACVNAAQGPYRALIPDNICPEQHALANSYLSFAIGLGSVIAAGTAPFLNWAFGYQMSIPAQFIMAALAFSLAMIWTCITTKEIKIKK